MIQTITSVRTRVVESFDNAGLSAAEWNHLLVQGGSNSVNLTWEWQRNWWSQFRNDGKLLLVVAERDGSPVAIAPCFSAGGMVFNICPEDHLDFIGDVRDPEVMEALLATARDCTPGFVGFRFYFIPDSSATGAGLQQAAFRLGLACRDEGDLGCPALDISANRAVALAATRKASLLRHEKYFRREGNLEVLHMHSPHAIQPHLDEFFEQHIARRAATDHPSLFSDPTQKEYYRSIVREIGPTGWLRFTRINWNGRAIAFHFGLRYGGRYLFGIPSFAIDLARRSPGEVLLRQLILAAIEENADTFDFGIGDEEYKYRFATRVERLRTWGLYPDSGDAA